ncbi:7108_t:CDS:2, partial [Racocetra persica]
VCVLVQHISTYSAQFEWMNVFKIAPVVDPGYGFLIHVKVPVYRSNNVTEFQESLKNVVKPYTDNINHDDTYVKVCQRLIVFCREIDMIVFLWKSIFRPGTTIYEDLNEYSLTHINYFISIDNANGLVKHLEAIPDDFDIDYVSKFHERIFTLLDSPETIWDENNIDSMLKLLNNTKLNWQKDSALKALNYIS